MTKPLLALSLVALAVACTQTPPPPVTPPPNPSAIARLEVTPAALLLTQQGQKQVLSVKAFNSSGAEVTATVTWVSSRTDQVTASASGELEAKVALGSSQIVAEVGGVKSAPVLVSVAQPAAGVVLIADAQVRGTATLVDPNAEADSDNPYEVLLTGITPPTVGSLLLGREGKAIGGEVISSVQEGDAVRVRLKLVPITTLMQTAQIKETLDYTNLQPSFPPELTQGYDIALKDGEYIFTPKPGAAATARAQKLTEFQLGPYKCDFATPELPVSLGQPGQFSLKFNPTLEIDFDRDAGLKKLIARADLSAKLKASLVLSAGGILNIDCAAPLYTKMLPLPGWAGLILAGELKAGLGFEIEGSLSIPLLGVELSSETKGTLEIGLDCTAGECKLVRNFNPINTNSVRFITPSIANIRTELFIYGYAFAKLKAGATLLEKLRMDVVTARAGLKLEGSFAPPSTQLEPNNNALEPDYQSSYKLGLLAEVVAGSINKAGDSAFRKLLLKLGIFKFNLLKFQTAKTLASSPKGAATLDKASFQAGDAVNFNVKLDPATTEFPFVGYNVERIVIMRKDGSSPAEELATVTATKDQLEFTLPWIADSDSTNPRGSAFYAFVDTALPVPFDLELGKLQVSECPRGADIRYCAIKLPAQGIDLGNSDEVTFGLNGIWHDGSFKTITPPANANVFSAYQVNGLGQIAGFLRMKDGTTHGALFANNAFTDFGSSNVAGVGQVLSLIDFNNKGQAVGSMQPTTVQDSDCPNSFMQLGCTAYFFSNGNVKRFDSGGSGIYSIGIDNSGRVIVVNRIEGGKSYAWNGTTITPLDNVPCCNFFTAIGVSPSGVIVGSKRVGNERVAFVYPSTALSNQQSSAQAINDAGAVVGSSRNGSNRSATLWEGANQIDLNTITHPANLSLTTAYAINSHGTILAEGLGYFVLLPFDRIQEKIVDLELSIIAPVSATPEGKLTYAVNLHNKSTRVVASNIRAEFFLPAGFTVTDTQGWSGCVTIQTTVTCTAPSLAAGERRAFLIDVQAPASGGDYIVSARVSANETDPNSSDNFDTGATLILEP